MVHINIQIIFARRHQLYIMRLLSDVKIEHGLNITEYAYGEKQ